MCIILYIADEFCLPICERLRVKNIRKERDLGGQKADKWKAILKERDIGKNGEKYIIHNLNDPGHLILFIFTIV